jgi:hypothetical protein
MRFEVRRIDHQPVGLAALARQRREDPVEHAHPAPADEAVVDRLVRPVLARRIAPAQAVANDEHDPRDHPPVIDPRLPMRQREIRLYPAHLRLRQPDQIAHGNALLGAAIESHRNRFVNPFNGS